MMTGMNHEMRTSPKKSYPKLPANTIGIDNFAFEPKTLTVKSGSTVMWLNRDDVPHLIISSTGKFNNSKVLDTEQQHSARFDTPGRYPYFCSLHPKMVGEIVVK